MSTKTTPKTSESQKRGFKGTSTGLSVDLFWLHIFHEANVTKETDEELSARMHREFPNATRDYLKVLPAHRAMYNRGSLVCQKGVKPADPSRQWVIDTKGERKVAPKAPKQRTRKELEDRITELEAIIASHKG